MCPVLVFDLTGQWSTPSNWCSADETEKRRKMTKTMARSTATTRTESGCNLGGRVLHMRQRRKTGKEAKQRNSEKGTHWPKYQPINYTAFEKKTRHIISQTTYQTPAMNGLEANFKTPISSEFKPGVKLAISWISRTMP